ncbi:MAG: hypothetical protein SRB2_04798 [Desulfobacteraceae bacterium Eth-SRB2]|nr:MAG: hypothetical protein SRB2_04798 [Desulfobacteraceae bacterium Eth-SRB2]
MPEICDRDYPDWTTIQNTLEEKGFISSFEIELKRKVDNYIRCLLSGSLDRSDSSETQDTIHFLVKDIEQKKLIENRIAQTDKLASIGQLSAGIAHGINNPLGITLFAKLIQEEYDLEEGAQEDLSRILKDAQRCRDTVKELLEFTRQTRHLMRPHDVNQTISRTLFLLESQTLFQNIEIETDLDASLPLVQSDIQQLNHLFMNIILNAAQAMEEKGRLTVKSRLMPDGNRVCIEIADTGPGIPEDILPQIFEQFFTTKEEGKGTGLGLSLAYSIVKNHGGNIMAKSKPGQGTTFIVEFPVADKENQGEESGDKI